MEIRRALILFACLFSSLAADTCENCFNPCCSKQHPLLEAKIGYFFFPDHAMNKIYDGGGVDVQLCGSYPVYKYLHVYASVEYLEKSGRSLHGNQKTRLWEIPVNLGLRAVFYLTQYLESYFSIGPRYFYVHAHNSSAYVPKNMSANGCGGFINTGLLFLIENRFTIDLFGEYSFKKLHFHSGKSGTDGQTVQVGGLTFGAGLGYSF